MGGVTRVGHIALRVRDLDAAVEFQSEILGLVETERRGRVSYLTCNERHHELILIESGRRGVDRGALGSRSSATERSSPTSTAQARA
jgi:catechol 2,3-dioxygenase-like lactoylglutathione lyase family enzyme